MAVLTGSIFIVITEVKVNCSAEFKNITPLVLIDNFVFWLLLKARNVNYWNIFISLEFRFSYRKFNPCYELCFYLYQLKLSKIKKDTE